MQKDKVFTAKIVRDTLHGDPARLKRIIFGTTGIVKRNDYPHYELCHRALIAIKDKLERFEMTDYIRAIDNCRALMEREKCINRRTQLHLPA